MPTTTIAFGLVLVVLGMGGYVGSGQSSVTALIPSAFGLLFVVLGAVARKEAMLKHAMHGAAMLALIGFFATANGLLELPAVFGGAGDRPMASISKSIMAVLMAVFLFLCIRSFRAARLAREQAATE